MRVKHPKDEHYPLLFFINNPDLNRSKEITSGAKNVLTKWPGNITSGFPTVFACFTLFMFMSLFFLISISSNDYLGYRCVKRYDYNNRTVHLVHSTGKWYRTELENLERLLAHFPNHTIHLVLIKDTPNKKPSKKLADLLKNREISLQVENYYEIFHNSPLVNNWPLLNEPLRLFATRVLQMWQFGGLNYDLSHKIDNFYDLNYTNATEIVSVDAKGQHFGTDIACHVFFEEILKLLKKCTGNELVQDIIDRAIENFCKGKKFCKFIKH